MYYMITLIIGNVTYVIREETNNDKCGWFNDFGGGKGCKDIVTLWKELNCGNNRIIKVIGNIITKRSKIEFFNNR